MDKIDRSRVRKDDEGREYIELLVCMNDRADYKGKAGVAMQNTLEGERRIYLANLYVLREE